MREKAPKAAFKVADPNAPEEVRRVLKEIAIEKLLAAEREERGGP